METRPSRSSNEKVKGQKLFPSVGKMLSVSIPGQPACSQRCLIGSLNQSLIWGVTLKCHPEERPAMPAACVFSLLVTGTAAPTPTHPAEATRRVGGNMGFGFHKERCLAGRQELWEALCLSGVAEGALPLPGCPGRQELATALPWGPCLPTVPPSQGGRQAGLWGTQAPHPRPPPSCTAEES